MAGKAIAGLDVKADGTYVDATFGAGGHSRALLAELGQSGRLIAVDADASCQVHAEVINDDRLEFVHANFRDLAEVVGSHKVNGVLMDLGISSMQLADKQRGFSFGDDGELDMRLDPSQGASLGERLGSVDERALGLVLREYGQERHWRRIAARILQRLREGRLNSTGDLAACCMVAAQGRWQRIHPATRTFQALRIWVNDELDSLVSGLAAASEALQNGGRLAVISFHSLEDRIVKRFMKRGDDDQGRVVQLGRMLRAEGDELEANRRARSAKLRVGEKR